MDLRKVELIEELETRKLPDTMWIDIDSINIDRATGESLCDFYTSNKRNREWIGRLNIKHFKLIDTKPTNVSKKKRYA